jgi:hypothetical protein
MRKRRIVQKKVDEDWQDCQMKDLRKGDIFRMFDTKNSDRVGDSDFKAIENPQLGINEKYPDVWGIKADPYKK